MKEHTLILVLLAFLAACGCSGGASSPLAPGPVSSDELMAASDECQAASSRVLWGLWEVRIDKSSGAVEVAPLRGATFNCNVAHFLSPPHTPVHLLTIRMLPGSDFATGYLDLEIGFTHPFTGLNQYRGFDVRGIFMADGSVVSDHDPAIRYGAAETNEAHMLNADGYTRWWNATEFTDPMPLFSFNPGKLGNDPDPSATLNPYRYYADDLAFDADVVDLSPETRGVFSPDGVAKKRNYQIQFPMNGTPSYRFNYAIDASWEPPDQAGAPDFPVESFPPGAQCQEAYHIHVDTSGTTAWHEDGNSGGAVHIALEVFDWQAPSNPDGVPGEVTAIWVESSVLASPVDILPLAASSPGSQTTSSVFQVELTGSDLNLTAAGTFSLLGSVESADPTTYQPQLPGGESFIYPDGPLAAYFMGTVAVGGEPGAFTILEPNGGEEWIIGTSRDILWTGGVGIETVKLEYSKDDFVDDIHTIVADIPNNGECTWDPIPDDPSETVKVRVSDATDPATYDDSDDYFTITGQCTFTDVPGYRDHVETNVVWSTGYHFMQVDSSRIVGCRFADDGDASFPWMAVYDESDFTAPVDTFEVPGWDHPDRPWCFEVDSTDRIFFFMDDDYPKLEGSTFDTIYYIDWDGSQLVDSSLNSFSISSFLDSGELGGKLWVDSNDDLYAVTTEGKMLKFDHTNGYAGEELFDLDGNPDYQQGTELDFLLAEEIDAFFIYTGYGSNNDLRAIHKVSYDGTVLASEMNIFSGILTKCSYLTGGIGTDGDCRLIVIDGHVMYSPSWCCVRYDYELGQKAWNAFDPPEALQPGNTVHFDDDLTIRFNTDAWAPMQTFFVFFDTPSDW